MEREAQYPFTGLSKDGGTSGRAQKWRDGEKARGDRRGGGRGVMTGRRIIKMDRQGGREGGGMGNKEKMTKIEGGVVMMEIGGGKAEMGEKK